MKIPDTDLTIEELLDRLPIRIQYVDKDGFLRYLNKADAAHPAKGKREVGINIRDCRARPESLQKIERIFEDFRRGRREPHHYITPSGNKSVKVPVFNDLGDFVGVLSFSHPVGAPKPDRTF
ncbi:MAG: PAS domain-containing protein [Deltaproteobacteria bacterium]|nr:PAS domain-containing protein [Deltaproteobacteria bacterium]